MDEVFLSALNSGIMDNCQRAWLGIGFAMAGDQAHLGQSSMICVWVASCLVTLNQWKPSPMSQEDTAGPGKGDFLG